MDPASVRSSGPSWARRNRAVLLALLPLMLLALGASLYWVYLMGHIALGAVAIFFPLALLVVPTVLGMAASLLGATFAGLGSLGFMMWMGGSRRHAVFAAPAVLVGAGFAVSWTFLQDRLATQVGEGFNLDWAAAALLAQAAYPLVTGLMALCVLLPERPPTRWAVARGVLGIALVWASLLSAFGPAMDWARDTLQRRSLEQVDEISSEGNRNPIVVAVCAGQLTDAAQLIQRQGRALDEGDVDALQHRCLRTNTSRFYAERVGVVLDATLAWEARGSAPAAPAGCTRHQKALLRKVFENNFPDAALQAFASRGLPISCPATSSGAEPLWWEIARSQHQPDLQTLTRLQAFGIDLFQPDHQGLHLVGANPNGIVDGLSDAGLLGLAELGFQDQPGGRTPHVLVIEVMRRRQGLGRGDAEAPDLLRAHAKVGDPTDAQLREALARAPWMLRADRDAQREREQQVRDAIERRLKSR